MHTIPTNMYRTDNAKNTQKNEISSQRIQKLHQENISCNLYMHFYIAKLRYAGVYLSFLFLLQNIDCGYSLEPPRRNKKTIKRFLLKIFNFYNLGIICVLHVRVFVM